MSGEPLCERLEWDSDFFGRPIGRIRGNRADAARIAEAKLRAREQAIECLYFLAAWDPPTIRAAEEHGFRLADIRVTLEARADDTGPWMDESIRPVRDEEAGVLGEMDMGRAVFNLVVELPAVLDALAAGFEIALEIL